MGIAQRHIHTIYAQKSRKWKERKPLATTIQTLGDWIQAKRIEQNLTPWHLAQKMGIASDLVRAWESCSEVPDANQMKFLAHTLGFNATDFEEKYIS